MNRRITPQTNLANLKNEAKRWLKELRADDKRARERFERGILLRKERVGLDFELLQKSDRAFAFVRHAVFQNEIGEIRKTQQLRLLAT